MSFLCQREAWRSCSLLVIGLKQHKPLSWDRSWWRNTAGARLFHIVGRVGTHRFSSRLPSLQNPNKPIFAGEITSSLSVVGQHSHYIILYCYGWKAVSAATCPGSEHRINLLRFPSSFLLFLKRLCGLPGIRSLLQQDAFSSQSALRCLCLARQGQESSPQG